MNVDSLILSAPALTQLLPAPCKYRLCKSHRKTRYASQARIAFSQRYLQLSYLQHDAATTAPLRDEEKEKHECLTAQRESSTHDAKLMMQTHVNTQFMMQRLDSREYSTHDAKARLT